MFLFMEIFLVYYISSLVGYFGKGMLPHINEICHYEKLIWSEKS